MTRAKIIEKQFTFFNELSARFSTNRIILHHTGGADIDAYAEQIHNWHLSAGYAGIGYHFVIRKNGSIERGRPIWAIGSHAYGANSDSIGIHLSGDFTYTAPTTEQINSCVNLIADLAEQYKITLDRKHILGHRDTIATDCPGNFLYSSLDLLISKAQRLVYGKPDVIDAPKTIWKPKAGMLTEHFSVDEFKCPCCGKCEMAPDILELLEQLRFNCGGFPIYIKSGYRCPTYNAKIRGNSYHCAGVAVDIFYPNQLPRGDFHWYIDHLNFDRVQYHDNFVHLSKAND